MPHLRGVDLHDLGGQDEGQQQLVLLKEGPAPAWV